MRKETRSEEDDPEIKPEEGHGQEMSFHIVNVPLGNDLLEQHHTIDTYKDMRQLLLETLRVKLMDVLIVHAPDDRGCF